MFKEFLLKGNATRAIAISRLREAVDAYTSRKIKRWTWKAGPEFKEHDGDWWAYGRIEWEK